MDEKYGDAIRAGRPVPCPHCKVAVRWVGVPEYVEHRKACAVIELGRLVGEMPPPEPPEVEKKPKGYGWV